MVINRALKSGEDDSESDIGRDGAVVPGRRGDEQVSAAALLPTEKIGASTRPSGAPIK